MRKTQYIPSDAGVIGFIGKEWKRKGLMKAIEIVKQLQISRPKLQFVVVGPEPESIQHLFNDWQDGYVLKGWLEHADYSEFDVLLHPAKAEPYGMVISEAMAAKVPVVISDICGSAVHVTSAAGQVLPLDSSIEEWTNAIEDQLVRTEPVPQFERSWCRVAREYENRWHLMNSDWGKTSTNELDLTGVYFTH